MRPPTRGKKRNHSSGGVILSPLQKLHDLRPYRQSLALGAEFPGIWDRAETLILRKPHPDGRELPTWPVWCLLPMAGWEATLPRPERGDANAILTHAADTARLSAIGSWRYSQGYYDYNPDVYSALTATPVAGDIPCGALLRLPEWCVYIATPGLTHDSVPVHGFYAHMESDARDGRMELRLLLDCESGFVPVPLHLGDWSVAEGIERMAQESARMQQYHEIAVQRPSQEVQDAAAAELARVTGIALSLILYLCSEEPEIEDDRQPDARPHLNRPQRTKRGKRIFVPERPRVWDVGKPTGERLRRAIAVHVTRHGVRPHIRRAHWHGFWSGTMDGERKFAYRWLPPIIVGDEQESI